jgi:hypothetical protein
VRHRRAGECKAYGEIAPRAQVGIMAALQVGPDRARETSEERQRELSKAQARRQKSSAERLEGMRALASLSAFCFIWFRTDVRVVWWLLSFCWLFLNDLSTLGNTRFAVFGNSHFMELEISAYDLYWPVLVVLQHVRTHLVSAQRQACLMPLQVSCGALLMGSTRQHFTNSR